MKYPIPASEQAQALKVGKAYSLTNSPNPDYEREFAILSDMRRDSMAKALRQSRGLSLLAKTPYCPDVRSAA